MSTPEDWVFIEVSDEEFVPMDPSVVASQSLTSSAVSAVSQVDSDVDGGGDMEYSITDIEEQGSTSVFDVESEEESTESETDCYDTTSKQTRAVEVMEFADTMSEHCKQVEIMAFSDTITDLNQTEIVFEEASRKSDSVLAVVDDGETHFGSVDGGPEERPVNEEADVGIDDGDPCGGPDAGGSGSGDLADDEGEREDDLDESPEVHEEQSVINQHVKTLIDTHIPLSQTVHRLNSHRREPATKKDTHSSTNQGAVMCRSVGILEGVATLAERNALHAAIGQDLAETNDIPIGDAVDLQLIGQDITAGTSFEQELLSTECSTRFDLTPAATRTGFTPANGKSSNEDTSGLIESLSGASGRNNPRAKNDVEVRLNVPPLKEAKLWAADFDTNIKFSSQVKQLQDGSSRSNEVSIPGHTIQQTFAAQDAQSVNSPHPDTTQTEREGKPDVSHQLESIATYNDDEVDITIVGDQYNLTQHKQVNVKITFQHRPLYSPQENGTTSLNQKIVQVSCSKDEGAEIKLSSKAGKDVLPPISSKASRETQTSAAPRRTNQCTRNTARQSRNVSMMASLNKHACLPPIQKHLVTGKNTSGHAREKRAARVLNSRRQHSPCDLDIINQRAQWPPFNTYLDKEASERYYRLINWVTSTAN